MTVLLMLCRCVSVYMLFFFSSRRRHTRCALVTGVQTCALPISLADQLEQPAVDRREDGRVFDAQPDKLGDLEEAAVRQRLARQVPVRYSGSRWGKIGRASCRERVCQYV